LETSEVPPEITEPSLSGMDAFSVLSGPAPSTIAISSSVKPYE